MERTEVKRPKILITNDDGVQAKGLHALIEAANPHGDIIVVAPIESQSGMSHAITVKHPLYINIFDSNGSIPLYGCSGTPVDCVKLALNELVDAKPDLLLSGINHGANSSSSVIYSGTMAAAREGAINGIPSIGFSLLNFSSDADFSHTVDFISIIIKNALQNGIPEGVCLNVNIPSIEKKDIQGIKICRQTKGRWIEEFEKRADPSNREYYWLTGQYKNLEPDATDTDEWALENNYISIVPLQIDMTSYSTIDQLKNWNHEG